MRVFMLAQLRPESSYLKLLAEALRGQGIEVVFLPYYQRSRLFPLFVKLMREPRRVDILHIHWIHPYVLGDRLYSSLLYAFQFLIDLLFSHWAGVKLVWTVHNQLSHNAKFPRLELWVRSRLSKLVDRLILLNQSTLNSLAQDYGFNPAKAEIIPHGHYRNFYQPLIDRSLARQALGLSQSGLVYLNLGILKPYKGIENLLKAWPVNQAISEGNTLLIAGKPYSQEYGLALAKLTNGLNNIVLISEFVEDHKIHLFFSAADVVVLPFDKILNSGGLILAMSFGKPIIAPDLGGIAEQLGDAGKLLYNPSDPQELARMLGKSLQMDLLELGKLTAQACDRLDWSPIAEKTLQVYQKSIKGGERA